MSQPLYAVKIQAQGEVRDSEGNLISSEPVEATLTLTADQIRALTEGDN